ncbi:hypothetical protein F2P79_002216 [Pimephales promelas]|nr:hypothetical protein F2P79_002216 [Pimephales promelas]
MQVSESAASYYSTRGLYVLCGTADLGSARDAAGPAIKWILLCSFGNHGCEEGKCLELPIVERSCTGASWVTGLSASLHRDIIHQAGQRSIGLDPAGVKHLSSAKTTMPHTDKHTTSSRQSESRSLNIAENTLKSKPLSSSARNSCAKLEISWIGNTSSWCS